MKLCENCKHNSVNYADGYIFRNWSGKFDGDPSTIPKEPDQTKFWTYQECAKNNKGLKHLNLDGKCSAFQQK